jgi:mannose-6-phosphate isomerase-like protein (cupin superfamily)
LTLDISPARPPRRVGAHDWGRMEWLVEEDSAAGAGMSVAFMFLNPAMATPYHRHSNCNEALTLLEGSIEEWLEGECFRLEAGQTLYAPAGSAHGIKNIGTNEARMMVAYSEGNRNFEAVANSPF